MNILTGRTRFRAGGWLNSKLVLQVEEMVKQGGQPIYLFGAKTSAETEDVFAWRDATTADLAELQRLPSSAPQIHLTFLQRPSHQEATGARTQH